MKKDFFEDRHSLQKIPLTSEVPEATMRPFTSSYTSYCHSLLLRIQCFYTQKKIHGKNNWSNNPELISVHAPEQRSFGRHSLRLFHFILVPAALSSGGSPGIIRQTNTSSSTHTKQADEQLALLPRAICRISKDTIYIVNEPHKWDHTARTWRTGSTQTRCDSSTGTVLAQP